MCDISASMKGKVAIVTGANSGMGFETAKILAKRGARVVVAGRNETKSIEAVRAIRYATGNDDVSYRKLDLASFESVRGFVAETYNLENKVDVLINNAGAISLPDRLTEDGLHMMMQVNYFGAFLLTYLLIPLLKSSTSSRIVDVTSSAMYVGTIDFDHMNDVGVWNNINLLGNSKLALTLFTIELDRRLKGSSVTANSMDPFLVANTDILRDIPQPLRMIADVATEIFGKSPKEAGTELAYLVMSPKLKGVGGRNFKNCAEFLNTWLASDTELMSDLWDVSKKLVKITVEEDWELEK